MKKVKINDIEFNIIEEEQYNYSNQVTEKSIEKQADITDHIQQNPLNIQVVGYFYDPRKVIGLSYFTDREDVNSADKMKQLLELNKNKEIITYEGVTKKIEDLVIQTITEIRTNKFKNGVQLDIRMQQIKTVEQKAEETQELQTGTDPVSGKEATEETTKAGAKSAKEELKIKIDSLAETLFGWFT